MKLQWSRGILPAQGALVPALDGSASAAFGAGPKVLALTTANANDVIVALTAGNGAMTAVSGGGLTFTQRALVNQPSGGWFVTAWTAVAATTLAATNFTLTYTSTNAAYIFGITNGNISTPFDPNPSLPVIGLVDPSTYSTSVPPSFVIAAISEGVANPALPSGFTDIARQAGSFSRLCFQVVPGAQSNTSVGFGVNANAAVYIDAVLHG